MRSTCFGAFLLAFLTLRATNAQCAPPNVVLILADDLGFSDVGCYGGEIDTPNLDALALDGIRFTQFYNTARCWPTRAAVLTGYYAQQVRRDTVPGVRSGSNGTRPAWARLLPEMLAPYGYRSYHSGKWHVDGLPLENGFAHSYSLQDHNRHFTPREHTLDDQPLPPVKPEEGYYSTTAIATQAIEQLEGHFRDHFEQPFFSLVAFTAPHFPVQAPSEEVAKYQARYRAGWDAIRAARWKRMEGIFGDALPPIERDLGPPYDNPEAFVILGPNEVNRPLEWITLTQEQQAFQADKMAVHAAMVACMDREIGRIVATLKEAQKLDDTLVVFLSDNGASAEIMVRGDGHDPHAECGTGATFLSIGPGWSSTCNTPFRRHKTWVHEGGIHTPCILRWPQGFSSRGELRHTPAHVVDFVPTVLELAATQAVASPAAAGAPRFVGRSLVPAFSRDVVIERESLWWRHERNRALRQGDWKIVASGNDAPWELYNLKSDPTETKNLAAEFPERVSTMASQWQKETDEYFALAKQGETSSPNNAK